jgi:hypothetical protein
MTELRQVFSTVALCRTPSREAVPDGHAVRSEVADEAKVAGAAAGVASQVDDEPVAVGQLSKRAVCILGEVDSNEPRKPTDPDVPNAIREFRARDKTEAALLPC